MENERGWDESCYLIPCSCLQVYYNNCIRGTRTLLYSRGAKNVYCDNARELQVEALVWDTKFSKDTMGQIITAISETRNFRTSRFPLASSHTQLLKLLFQLRQGYNFSVYFLILNFLLSRREKKRGHPLRFRVEK